MLPLRLFLFERFKRPPEAPSAARSASVRETKRAEGGGVLLMAVRQHSPSLRNLQVGCVTPEER